MTSEPTFQRARRPEHKQQRFDAILDAARALALRDGVRNISLADIAAEVSVHKSALLRYFQTRDEIYLHLAGEAWTEWTSALCAVLENAPAGSVDAVADAFTTTLGEQPLLCDLLSHVALNLERNVPLDSLRTYKLLALACVAEIRTRVNRVLPELTETDTFDLVASATSISAGLWQVSHPVAELRNLCDQDPQFRHAVVDFLPSLRRMTETTLLGLQARHAQR